MFNIFGNKKESRQSIRADQVERLEERIDELEKERFKLKEQVSDLELEKKKSEEDIKHMTRMKEERLKNEFEHKEKMLKVQIAETEAKMKVQQQEEIHKMQREFQTKLEQQLNTQIGGAEKTLAVILERLPNVNVELTRSLDGPAQLTDESSRSRSKTKK